MKLYIVVGDVDACRYQFFLQLKLDILTGRLPCEFDMCVELAALAVQCTFTFSLHCHITSG